MSSIDDILDAIDTAVRDHTVSLDAMRCVPEGDELTPVHFAEGGHVSLEGTGSDMVWDTARLDRDVVCEVYDDATGNSYRLGGGEITSAFVRPFREPSITLTMDTGPLVAAFESFGEVLRQAGEEAVQLLGRYAAKQQNAFHRVWFVSWPPDVRREHRARCRVCNPGANPRPLPINGHEYNRRRRNRRRNR